MTVDSGGNVYVLDGQNGTGFAVRRIVPDGTVTTLAGQGPLPAPATDPSSFLAPRGIATDNAGNLFVADATQIRRIGSNGEVTRYAGQASFPSETVYADFPGQKRITDGPPGVASFANISDLARDKAGNLFVVDTDFLSNTNTVSLRKIDLQGNVTTLASIDRGGYRLAIDADGNLYLYGSARLHKVTPDGTVSLIAEAPDYSVPSALGIADSKTLVVALRSGLFMLAHD
jgi:sugar lactone lactonase YvrE